MQLNDNELSIMEEVRDMMYMDAESGYRMMDVSGYICGNVLYVLLAREGYAINRGESWLTPQSKETLAKLRDAILKGIAGRMTFNGFMRRHGPKDFWQFKDDGYCQACMLGRLAWLDKIVETGEIAPEFPVEVESAA